MIRIATLLIVTALVLLALWDLILVISLGSFVPRLKKLEQESEEFRRRIAPVEGSVSKIKTDQELINHRMDWLRVPETPQPK